MRLIYHPLSPYSRKVYVLAIELGLAHLITLDKVVVAPVPYPGWSDNNLYLSDAGNPLAKIPTLVVEDIEGGPLAIFDSKVICEYLIARAGTEVVEEIKSDRVRWQEKSIHAACDGMVDAEILCVYEERIRAEKGLLYQPWIDGQREKVTRGFDFLERMAKSGAIRTREAQQTISLAEVSAAVALRFFDTRKVEWRQVLCKHHWQQKIGNELQNRRYSQ
ncbi:hypothetical protein NA57DRAFT_73431 [Rhizodiscina lignyota]|uniref:GST N-terminal domain-containing protein n=1 Tax=Rhizodiscina lignyota TaxID=1504668 RepID=A0A9P4IHY2_9PEZI|nr:hypothetical protein NA57DRAFT_73431 [Rhizodiscina lignyota]